MPFLKTICPYGLFRPLIMLIIVVFQPFLAMKAIFLVFINPKEMFSKSVLSINDLDIFSTDK
jgi:hypothetical protein